MAIISGVMSLLLWFVYVPIKAFSHDPNLHSKLDTFIRFMFSLLFNFQSEQNGLFPRCWDLFSPEHCQLLLSSLNVV
jgi:hypothetical protein